MSTIFEYLRALYRHFRALASGGSLIVILGLLKTYVPDDSRWSYVWNHLPLWLVVLLAPLGVLVAQVLMWRDLREEREDLKRQLKLHRKQDRTAALRADLDLRFSFNSRPNHERLESAIALFEKLEAEVLAGDFSNADELFLFQDHFQKILQGWFGSGGAYVSWHRRLLAAVSTVSRHHRELVDGTPS